MSTSLWIEDRTDGAGAPPSPSCREVGVAEGEAENILANT